MTTELTMNIEGLFMRQIINCEKRIEYRDITPHWEAQIGKCKAPFLLRLINGMRAEAPEIVVEVVKVRKDKRKSKLREHGVYCLYLGKVKSRKIFVIW